MNLEQAITKRIYNLCEAKNITPNKLANMAGISSSTLKSIFYSKSKNTGLRTILELCQALDITVFDFFDDPIFIDKELEGTY